ncbi:MAG: glycosyltransferase [Chitinophagaceae bacterium]|nr:MAG: glycosyltransferase [Chitinophagaceae bacterium]
MTKPELSIVIPLFDEEESLPELYEWIKKVTNEHNLTHEIIFADDGSRDNSWEVIKKLSESDSSVKAFRFMRNYGKSAALNEAFKICQGKVVITMDADLQDSPDEIPGLYKMIKSDGYDLVSGWKKTRHDPVSKTIPSKFFNYVTSISSGIKLHDFNCGLKAYNSKVIKSIEIYGEMHRYIPVMAKQAGFDKIGEKVVEHRARKYGTTKFGLERFINGFLDLMSILFVTRFGKKPMHFFGTWGVVMFSIGMLILLYLSVGRLAFHAYGMTSRPLFFFAIVFVLLGAQLFLTGFLAELVSRSSADRNNYLIDEKISNS